jgi:hypothetical protein
MYSNESGRFMEVRGTPANVLPSSRVTDFGIVIEFKFVKRKAAIPILFTEFGIVIEVIGFCINAASPIVSSELDNLIDVSPIRAKASRSNTFTELGSVSVFKFV